MWSDLLIRFALGGIAVSIFALVGDLFRPKSFAGLFSAAPSIALGTLGLTMVKHGGSYAALEGRSMVMGAIALYLYSHVVSWLLIHHQLHSLFVSVVTIGLWFVSAFGMWFFLLK
jgi:hypothetical protein